MLRKLKYNRSFRIVAWVVVFVSIGAFLFSAHRNATLAEPSRVLSWKMILDRSRTEEINKFFRSLPEYYIANNEHELTLQREALAAIFELSDEVPRLTDREIATRLSEILKKAKSGGSYENIGWTRGIAILTYHLDEYFEKFHNIDNGTTESELRMEVYAEIGRLRTEIPDLTDLEIKIRIQYILAKLGDSHTHTSLLTTDGIDKVYPFYANSYEDGLWIIGVFREKYAEAINCKILKINDVPIDEIFEKLCNFVGYENEIFVKARYGRYIACPEILFAINIINNVNDEISITLEDLDGSTKTVVFDEKVPTKERVDESEATLITDRIDGEKAFYARRDSEDIWVDYIEESKILFIRLNTFHMLEGKWEMNSEFDPYERIKEISSKYEIEKIVMDYRGNTGGWTKLDYPWQNLVVDLANEVPLFLATNWNSYSAAPNQALYFKNNTNAVLIGMPTSSGLLEKMDPKEIDIPNKNFSLTFSTSNYYEDYASDAEKVINHTKLSDYWENTIYPDFYVSIGIEDYIQKRDPIMEYISGL